MQNNYWEDIVDYEVIISKGFTELKTSAYTHSDSEPPIHFKTHTIDKSTISKYLFNGFSHVYTSFKNLIPTPRGECRSFLIAIQPNGLSQPKDNFKFFIKMSAISANICLILSQKAAITWCNHATNHAKTYNGKPWRYLLIPHDEIAENNTIDGLCLKFKI